MENQRPDDKATDRVVERIRAEGQLTRNSGTNSIKSINVNLNNFTGIFQSMHNTMLDQTNILRENLSVLVEENERLRRLEDMERVSRRNPDPAPVVSPRESKKKDGNSNSFSFGLGAGMFGGGIGGLFSALGITGGFNIVRAAILGLAAEPLGNYLGEFAKKALESAEFSEGFSESVGDGVGRGVTYGMFGRIFGKKIAVIAGAGGFLSTLGDELANALGLDDEDLQKHLIGDITTGEVIEGTLGAIGAGITAFMISPKFRKVLSIGLGGSLAIGSGIFGMARKLLGVRGVVAAAVAGLFATYGDDATRWLDEKTGLNHDWSSVLVDGAKYGGTALLTLGSMFGIQGKIALVLGGLAFSLGKYVANKIRGLSDKVDKETFDNLENADLSVNERTGDAMRAAQRIGQGGFTEAEKREAEEHLRNARRITVEGVENGNFNGYQAQQLAMMVIDEYVKKDANGKYLPVEDSEKLSKEIFERLAREGLDTEEEMGPALMLLQSEVLKRNQDELSTHLSDLTDQLREMTEEDFEKLKPRRAPDPQIIEPVEISRSSMREDFNYDWGSHFDTTESRFRSLAGMMDMLEGSATNVSNNINFMPMINAPSTQISSPQTSINTNNLLGGLGGGSSLDLPGNVS